MELETVIIVTSALGIIFLFVSFAICVNVCKHKTKEEERRDFDSMIGAVQRGHGETKEPTETDKLIEADV